MSAPVDVIFAALASPTRRELLRLLRTEGPQPVQRLAANFPMRRPSVSEHLKVLRDAGLVSGQKRGRQWYYRLEAGQLAPVREWLSPYEPCGQHAHPGRSDHPDEASWHGSGGADHTRSARRRTSSD